MYQITSIQLDTDQLMKLPKHSLINMIVDQSTELSKYKNKLYTKQQACEIVGLKLCTLEKRLADGSIKKHKLDETKRNGAVRISHEEIMRYMALPYKNNN